MSTRRVAALVTTLLAVGALPAFCQDVSTILQQLTNAYQGVKSYQAQASIVETRQGGGQQQRRNSTVTTKYKAPNKVVTIVQGAENMQLYSDGKNMYIYSPKDKEYVKLPAPTTLVQAPGMSGIAAGDPSQIGNQLRALLGSNAKRLADRTVGGRPVFVLQAVQSGQSADSSNAMRMTITAFVDKANYLLRQLSVETSRGQGNQAVKQSLVVTFTSQQINPNLPDSAFVFKPPAGAKERQVPPPQPSGAPAPPR